MRSRSCCPCATRASSAFAAARACGETRGLRGQVGRCLICGFVVMFRGGLGSGQILPAASRSRAAYCATLGSASAAATCGARAFQGRIGRRRRDARAQRESEAAVAIMSFAFICHLVPYSVGGDGHAARQRAAAAGRGYARDSCRNACRLASNSIAALCERCSCAVASASCASTFACSASIVAGWPRDRPRPFPRAAIYRAPSRAPPARVPVAPACSARCTDAFATAILSLGIGLARRMPRAPMTAAAQALRQICSLSRHRDNPPDLPSSRAPRLAAAARTKPADTHRTVASHMPTRNWRILRVNKPQS